jgi:glucose/arabinose dehydrogenase/mono/diheme cytochrome c family protein
MRTFFLLFLNASLAQAAFRGAPPSSAAQKSPFKSGYFAAAEAGKKLFSQNCASCHGPGGEGTSIVPDLTRNSVQQAKPGELFWFISTGSSSNGMPPSKLPVKERWEIISYLKTLKNKGKAPSPIALESTTDDLSPAPSAPFTDYRFEKPGQSRKILSKDLPEPSASSSNGPIVVPRPANAWPKAPPGFSVQLYASGLDDPRALRLAPNGDIFLAESKPGQIRVFRGMNAEGKAGSTEIFAEGLRQPYGLAFYPPGPDPKWLYVGSTDSVVRIPYRSGDLRARGKAELVTDLPHEDRGHWTRDIAFTADGKQLFAAVGSASNVNDPDRFPSEKDRADILVMSPEGKEKSVYAYGIRNAGGGLAIQPSTGDLWCSVNERDGLGDNLVPDYITRVKAGGFYGWPWWYIGGHEDSRLGGRHPELRAKSIVPDVLIQPHNASLQLVFYDGKQFPTEYIGDIFSSQHGSWNRSVRAGYEVIRVPFHGALNAEGSYEDFLTGFVVDASHVWGRPVGIAVASDGSLLVSDDGSNSIWRVSYKK